MSKLLAHLLLWPLLLAPALAQDQGALFRLQLPSPLITHSGQPSAVVATVPGNAIEVEASSYFDSADWTGAVPKKLVVPEGVRLWSADASVAALAVHAFGGTFELEVAGEILGAGGAGGVNGVGGNGGDAIDANGLRFSVVNTGRIVSGGGGGGAGGKGGDGNQSTPGTYGSKYNNSFNRCTYEYKQGQDYFTVSLFWEGNMVESRLFTLTGVNSTYTRVVDGHYYRCDPRNSVSEGVVARPISRAPSIYSPGSPGGNGGRGEGGDGPAAAGQPGSTQFSSSAGAARGGHGASGAAAGAHGQPGAPGDAGGFPGEPGFAGGLSGFAISDGALVDVTGDGNLIGRL
jgi:hypothetical protein